MNFTTPQEVFAHIISIYEKCDTLSPMNTWICSTIDDLFFNKNELSNQCKDIVHENFDLIDSDLKSPTGVFLLSRAKAIEQNRQKEYIQIKIDYLKQLIELCDKESN